MKKLMVSLILPLLIILIHDTHYVSSIYPIKMNSRTVCSSKMYYIWSEDIYELKPATNEASVDMDCTVKFLSRNSRKLCVNMISYTKPRYYCPYKLTAYSRFRSQGSQTFVCDSGVDFRPFHFCSAGSLLTVTLDRRIQIDHSYDFSLYVSVANNPLVGSTTAAPRSRNTESSTLSPRRDPNDIGMIVGVAIGATVLITLFILCCVCICKRREAASTNRFQQRQFPSSQPLMVHSTATPAQQQSSSGYRPPASSANRHPGGYPQPTAEFPQPTAHSHPLQPSAPPETLPRNRQDDPPPSYEDVTRGQLPPSAPPPYP